MTACIKTFYYFVWVFDSLNEPNKRVLILVGFFKLSLKIQTQFGGKFHTAGACWRGA